MRCMEQPIRLWILRGVSPLAVNCLYSDGKHMRAEQRAVQEGSSPSGARMRSAISKSGGNSSLAGEGGRYGEAYTGTKAKAGYSQGEPEAISCKSPEGRVSTVRGIRRACGEVPGRSRWGNPRRTGRPKAGEVEPALWRRRRSHSPAVPRCLRTARYGRAVRDLRRTGRVSGW